MTSFGLNLEKMVASIVHNWKAIFSYISNIYIYIYIYNKRRKLYEIEINAWLLGNAHTTLEGNSSNHFMIIKLTHWGKKTNTIITIFAQPLHRNPCLLLSVTVGFGLSTLSSWHIQVYKHSIYTVLSINSKWFVKIFGFDGDRYFFSTAQPFIRR